MSYGKYGMKNIGGVSPNNMMGIAYNDPGFALGALIAQNYNKNWEDRGNQKAIDAALASLSPTGNAQEQQLATQQFQGMQPPQEGTLQGRNMLGIGAGYTIPTSKGLLGEDIPASAAPTQAAPTGTGLFGSMSPPNAPNGRGLLGLQGTPQGTGLFGSMSDTFPSMRAKEEQPKQGLFASVFPEPEKDLKEQLKEKVLSESGLLTGGLLLNKLWEADQQKKNSSGRQLLGLESTDGPSARELLGLQDAPEGTGLLSSILPPKETKEEPEGGLLTNAMINYHLNGPGSSVENTSNQMLKDYLGDYSLGKDAEGNTVLNKSQGIGDIAQQMADQRLQNFDANQWMANMQLSLMRQGYSPEQIGYIMEPLAQKAMGIQKEQYEAKAGEAIDQFFNLANQGKYGEANAVLYKATQYAPDMINKILSGSVAPKDIYATQTGRENMVLQHELGQKGADANVGRQITLNDHSFANQVKLAELKRAWDVADNKERIQLMLQYPEVFGKSKNSAATQQKAFLAAADKEITAFQKWQELYPEKKPEDYPYYKRFQQAQAYKDQYWGVGQFDENDYYAWGPVIEEAKRNGYTDAQIIEAVRAHGGDQTEAIISGYNLTPQQAAPQAAPQAQPQKPQVVVQMPAEQVDDGMFEDRGEGLTGVFRWAKDKTGSHIKHMVDVSQRK